MPRDLLKKLRRKKHWADFVKTQREKAPKRRPTRVRRTDRMTGTLYAIRNKRMAIREGAVRRVSVVIVYKKITTNRIKKFEVIPLSWRYKRLKKGFRKVLYAIDKMDPKKGRQLKNFVLKNIRNVMLTDRKFKPDSRYPVEIT